MPQDNKDAYKEMYEMGERLMQMAKDGGYDPESSDYSDSEAITDDTTDSAGSADKVKAALGMFANG